MAEFVRMHQVLDTALAGYVQQHWLSPRQWQVCHHIQSCRTQALGETRWRCDQCGDERTFYCACRDRHCPRCQRQASQDWCDRQRRNTINVPYHHVVFTLPQAINGLAQLEPEAVYDQLLKSAWATLKCFGDDPKRLGGQLGATLVLHTWGQTLSQHLHVHALVPGGALTQDGSWHPARSTYLFPVRALSRYFRGHFVSGLRERDRQGSLERVERPEQFSELLRELMAKDWVVYSKPCLQRTDTVVEYLARYTHRIALSESRLLQLDDDQVQLRYKDYRDHDRQKVLRLSAEELLRRFLLHVLPKGFMRIRHYGFLANCVRRTRLAQVRRAIDEQQDAAEQETDVRSSGSPSGCRCPSCGEGVLHMIALITPHSRWLQTPQEQGPPLPVPAALH